MPLLSGFVRPSEMPVAILAESQGSPAAQIQLPEQVAIDGQRPRQGLDGTQ